MLPLAALGVDVGARGLSRLASTYSDRKRQRRLQERLLQTLEPLQTLLNTSAIGPSMTEGSLMQSATTGTLQDLADRGILRSSFSAPAIARAVAPIEERRQARRMGLMERIAAAKQSIYGATEQPGYGEALAGTLGDVGSAAEMYAGWQSVPDLQQPTSQMDQIVSGSPDPLTYPDPGADNPIMRDILWRRQRRQMLGY